MSLNSVEGRKFSRGSIRPEVVALALLVPLVIVIGVVLTRWPSQAIDTPVVASPVVATSSPVILEVTPEPSTTSVQSAAAVDLAASPKSAPISIRIASPAGVKSYQVQSEPATVLQVLQQAREQGLTLVTKDFGGSLGIFVEAINGIHSDNSKQLYWHLYLNGARSPLGASVAQVKAGDAIMWKLEKAHQEDGQ